MEGSQVVVLVEMWRISQVVILVGMWRVSQVVAPVDGGITSCDSCKRRGEYHKLWSLSMEGSQVVVAENRGAPPEKIIVGLNVALKGPFPLVGESELSRESEMSRNFWCDFTLNFFARNIKN
jgi:hypothetical protein